MNVVGRENNESDEVVVVVDVTVVVTVCLFPEKNVAALPRKSEMTISKTAREFFMRT